MKEKIISILILIIMVISILGSFSNEVVAYSGEIDPKNYITLPSIINVRDKVGTGTIRLSSSASGYTISYQKVDITKAELDSISAKFKEINEYTKTSNETIKEKGDIIQLMQNINNFITRLKLLLKQNKKSILL